MSNDSAIPRLSTPSPISVQPTSTVRPSGAQAIDAVVNQKDDGIDWDAVHSTAADEAAMATAIATGNPVPGGQPTPDIATALLTPRTLRSMSMSAVGSAVKAVVRIKRNFKPVAGRTRELNIDFDRSPGGSRARATAPPPRVRTLMMPCRHHSLDADNVDADNVDADSDR